MHGKYTLMNKKTYRMPKHDGSKHGKDIVNIMTQKQQKPPQDKNLIKAHLYMKLTPKKRDNYIQETFNKWKEKPDRNKLTKQEQYNHGFMHLTTQTEHKHGQNPEKDTRKCPTCKQEYLTLRALNGHRANKDKCKKQWQQEKPWRRICPNIECGEKFHTIAQLQIHLEQHQTLDKQQEKLYTLDPEGPIDRRKMIYQGLHNPDQKPTKAPIIYLATTRKWKCTICGRGEKEQDKQNLIIHAHKHRRKNHMEITHKIPQTTNTQQEINQLRIKTLQIPPEIETNETQLANMESGNQESQNNTNTPPKTASTTNLRQELEYLKPIRRNRENSWKCCLRNCTQEHKTMLQTMRHIAKQHHEQWIPARTKTQSPYCLKSYTNLLTLLQHLELQEASLKWDPRYCPQKPQTHGKQDTWQHILEWNKIPPEQRNKQKDAPIPTENREIARRIKTQQDKALREQSKPKIPKLDIPIEQQEPKIHKRTQKCKKPRNADETTQTHKQQPRRNEHTDKERTKQTNAT